MLCRSPKELATLVMNYRKKFRLSQMEVSKRVGLKQKTISAFENNPENTKLSTLFLILSAVNLDIKLLSKDETKDTNWSQEW